VEIKNSNEVVEHCRFLYDYKMGMNLYMAYPYLLVMDEHNTKLYSMEGPSKLKTPKLMHTFYEA
jgi:hypothetical protein